MHIPSLRAKQPMLLAFVLACAFTVLLGVSLNAVAPGAARTASAADLSEQTAAPEIAASSSFTVNIPIVVNRFEPPIAQIRRQTAAGLTPLDGTILDTTTITVHVQLTPGVSGVSVHRQKGSSAEQDITSQFAGLEANGSATASLTLTPGDYVFTVRGSYLGAARSTSASTIIAPDDMVVLSSDLAFPFVDGTAPDGTPIQFEDNVLLLNFVDTATPAQIADFLRSYGLRPLDWIGPLRFLRVQVDDDRDEATLAAEINSAHDALLEGALLNRVGDRETAVGERMPTPLGNSYRTDGNADCSAAGSNWQGCFPHTAGSDTSPARIYRYHFFMDTFAGHRLVQHLLPVSPTMAGLAITDSGLGNGTVPGAGANTNADIPAANLFGFASGPFNCDASGIDRKADGSPKTLADVADTEGHGTNVAAAAAARGVQILGTGRDVNVRPMKDNATIAQVTAAIACSASHPGVQVMNLSWGTRGATAAEQTNMRNALTLFTRAFQDVGFRRAPGAALEGAGDGAFSYADLNTNGRHDAGEPGEPFNDANGNRAYDPDDLRIFVNSAGNLGAAIPANHAPKIWIPPNTRARTAADLLMMGASGSQTQDTVRGPEQLRGRSSFGPQVSVAAPGGEVILPDQNGALGAHSGTSYAAPAVAGLAAEMRLLDRSLNASIDSRLTPLQIIEAIEATADDLGTTENANNTTRPNDAPGNGTDPYFGHGRINVWKAILAVVNRGVAAESHAGLAANFPSLTSIDEANTRWYGFKIHAPIRGATVWLDGVQVTDAGSTAPGGIVAYAGVRTDRTIRIGVSGEDPTSGVVPLGSNSDFLITFSIERGDLIAAGSQKVLQLRRPGQTAADAPFFNLELDLEKLRRNEVPGVVFDDFVFEITPPDFGDASASPTILADDGARHLHNQMEYLGKANATFSLDAVSPEHKILDFNDPDGIPNWGVDLEDLDGKDDGVVFYPLSYRPGGTGRVDVRVCVAETGARYDRTDRDKQIYVNGWIDWSTNGAWEEGSEHVLDGLRLAPVTGDAAGWAIVGVDGGAVTLLSSNRDCGQYKVEFAVPATIGQGKLESRWRLDYGENVGRWANSTFTSTTTLSLTVGAARYGEVEDYIIGPDFGDAGKDPPWPTKLARNGPRHLSFYREWIGPYNGGTPRASREPDACATGSSDQDGGDNLGDDCSSKDRDGLDDFSVEIPRPGIIRVKFDVSSGVQGYGFDGGNGGVKTLKSDCSLGAIAATPETPTHQQVNMRYDANNPAERLYAHLYADWDGDGSFESTVFSGPVDPEDFGADGAYTLGEPFVDANRDGVWNPGESFTDAAGVTTRSFVCEFPAPVPPPAGITQWLRLRLDYGENAGGSILRGEPFEEDPLHTPAGELGGAVWGEVEDLPLAGGEPPHRTWTWDVPMGVPFTTGPASTKDLPGTGPYTFKLVEETVTLEGMTNTPLPNGLNLDEATGEISGVVLEGGTTWPLIGIYEGFGTPGQELVGVDWHHFRVPVHITTHLLDQTTGRPIPNFPMTLYSGEGCTGTPLKTVNSDEGGMVWFRDLEPITYTVELTPPEGWTGVGDTCQWVNLGEFRALTRTLLLTDTLPNTPGQVDIPLFGAIWGVRGSAPSQSDFSLLQGGMMLDYGAAQDADQDGLPEVQTEIVEMHLEGVSELGSIRIRESPDQPSRGQSEELDPTGGFMVDSFFDVFTEISLDGGQTWTPSTNSAHFQAQADRFPPYGSTMTTEGVQYGNQQPPVFQTIYQTLILLDPTEQPLLFLARPTSP